MILQMASTAAKYPQSLWNATHYNTLTTGKATRDDVIINNQSRTIYFDTPLDRRKHRSDQAGKNLITKPTQESAIAVDHTVLQPTDNVGKRPITQKANRLKTEGRGTHLVEALLRGLPLLGDVAERGTEDNGEAGEIHGGGTPESLSASGKREPIADPQLGFWIGSPRVLGWRQWRQQYRRAQRRRRRREKRRSSGYLILGFGQDLNTCLS